MSVKKKEYRKYSNLGLRMSPNNGLLHAEQVKYIIRTAVKNIDGQRMLLLYVYAREQAVTGNFLPCWTVFQSRKDYITLAKRGDGTVKWQTSMLENLERDYYFEKKCAFYTPKDEQRVTLYCDPDASTGFLALNHLQQRIKAQKELERRHQKQRKIIRRMAVVPALPRDLKGWVHREVLPAYLFYNYHKGKGPMKGYCTFCRHEVEVTGAKHNQKGSCPRCKKEVMFKSRGRRGYIHDKATAQILQQVGPEEILIRIIKIYCTYHKQDIPDTRIYENMRIIVSRDEQGKFTAAPYHSSYERGDITPWKEGYVPVMYQYQENFNAETCGHLYHRNLEQALAGTPWQYCQLKEFYLSDRKELDTVPYLRTYLEAPMLEYLVKLRLYWLAAHAVYGSRNYYGHSEVLHMKGNTLKEVLGVEKTDIPFLQQVNVGIRELQLLQILRAEGLQPDTAFFMWVKEHNIQTMNDLVLPLRYTTPHKLIRYLEERYEALRDRKGRYGGSRYQGIDSVLTEYKDYLKACEKLEYDLKNSFISFPINLPEAHDQASKLLDRKKVAQYDEQIAGIYKRLSKLYQFRKGGLVVLPPKSAQEIVVEGQTLHHCVGGYVTDVVENRCAILFIRKEGALKKPFFTVEVQGDKIIQVQGKGHIAPTPEVEEFLAHWTKKKALNMKTAA
ncbi:PcfJ domain-containing protein [Anaerocolumna xylanovorans]|uniref:PcfJ-like protein n=1 Tax=Anaerocolumna xylanovorans DSM 12503 TaxID=1121345 RepID=A0A1M7YNB9_9FIRM|nr:PcfJ domain-containing protein [Anaerocolumna xylanovorans]SHO54133.1 PcfJ-like protein [Anaerocolumna xylanovorans DSM 12503]